MSFNLILKKFQSLHPKYINLNLDRIMRLLSDLDNPHFKLPPTIHIAGTNGKGSTTAFLRSMLEIGGLKTHSYTSPHLVNFNERIRLNGKIISDELLLDILTEVDLVNKGKEITFFEITTAAAFLVFSRIESDILLLEVGLGGRLDATNVIPKPLATIITNISLDHEHFLGNTLNDIAYEKCGIIKPNCPVFTPIQDLDVIKVIEQTADKLNSPITILNERILKRNPHTRKQSINFSNKSFEVPPPSLMGKHQLDNSALAATCIYSLKLTNKLPKLNFEEALKGVSDTTWPGRTQRLIKGKLVNIIRKKNNSFILLDGAHNTSGALVLKDTLNQIHEGKWVLIFGSLKTRNPLEFLKILKPISNKIITVQIPNQKESFSEFELLKAASKCGFEGNPAKSIKDAFNKANLIDYPICICGSLYLAGEVLKLNKTIPD